LNKETINEAMNPAVGAKQWPFFAQKLLKPFLLEGKSFKRSSTETGSTGNRI
jgi:hypothetical protein